MLRLGHALHSCRLAQPCVWNTLQVLDEGVWAVDFSSQIRRAHSDERPQRRGGRRGGERRSPGKRGSSEQERPMESALFDLLTSSSTKKPSKELDSLLKVRGMGHTMRVYSVYDRWFLFHCRRMHPCLLTPRSCHY
jgi:hypothetical protein